MDRDKTRSFYEQNASEFFRATVSVDMAPLYAPFLRLLPPKAHILDAGCGSGRDALAFKKLGFRVSAFDASPTMAALASEHLGQAVQVLSFEAIDWQEEFDGIWACASLLHLRFEQLPDVFRRLSQALKKDGVLYCSFKYGQGEREAGGRWFTDMDEAGMRGLAAETPGLSIIEIWQTADQRPGREDERWLNALLRREVPA